MGDSAPPSLSAPDGRRSLGHGEAAAELSPDKTADKGARDTRRENVTRGRPRSHEMPSPEVVRRGRGPHTPPSSPTPLPNPTTTTTTHPPTTRGRRRSPGGNTKRRLQRMAARLVDAARSANVTAN